jgi:LysR family hydrogen peroxide-inducible transcriptional activator
MEEGHCLRAQALSVCARAGAAEVEVRAASLSTLLAMVEAGLGPTLCPLLALTPRALDPLRAAGVRALPFRVPAPSRILGLRWRASSPWAARLAALAPTFTTHADALHRALPPDLRDP